MTDVEIPPAPRGPGAALLEAPTITGEPKIHGIVGTYFGDNDVDVGKSVRWLHFYVDDLYIQDTNSGEQRYWVINWDASFPDAKHGVASRNFFTENAQWRKDQFLAADLAWHYDDADWCIFIDGSEGISFDNRSFPDDYAAAPFMSWLYREIDRATGPSIILPFYAYVKNSDLQNVTYQAWTNTGGAGDAPQPQQAVSVPWYVPNQGLRRMFLVSELRKPAFDWTQLDKFVAVADPLVKTQIISYAYAHWRPEDIPPGETTVPPLDAGNDRGWDMRCLVSMLRPVSGLPYAGYNTSSWSDPSLDPPGAPGPWCVDTMSAVLPGLIIEEQGHTAPDASTAGVRTPLYDTVFRLNLRDGLWYEHGASGNIPLAWDDVNNVWVPTYSPDEWVDSGVGSSGELPPEGSTMSLSLNGASGSYCWTGDANYLDFKLAFTVVADVKLVTYKKQQIIASKWGAAPNCSWRFGTQSDGKLYLEVSHDGTNIVQAVCSVVPPLNDNGRYELGVSYTMVTQYDVTGVPSYFDEVRFWVDGVMVGTVRDVPNNTGQPVFNSTTHVNIGANTDGTANMTAGLFHWVSLRAGVGQENALGGSEVALMRGDLTTNPTYDRYGNLWNNVGGWSYVDMNPPS